MTETTASTTAPRRSTRRTSRVVGALTVAVALGALGVGCSDSKDSSASTETTEAITASSSTTVASGTTGGEGGGGTSGNTGGNGGGGTNGGGTTGGGGGASKITPVINSFTTPENIDCHNGNLQNFTASWSTTDATKVTISIDGPGIYATYGPSGETSLPFNCSSSHTFLLTATSSDGTTATKQITLQPRNVQPQGGEDQEQE